MGSRPSLVVALCLLVAAPSSACDRGRRAEVTPSGSARPDGADAGAAGDAAAGSTRVVLLGTGTPRADPERSGPGVAVVVRGQAYLVDCGAGVVRRAEAARRAGTEALGVRGLTRLFVTHLHSDHTLGYADLILSPWVLGRPDRLQAYGPPGLREMTDHLLAAYSEDAAVRTAGLEGLDPALRAVEVHEVSPGEVYRDDRVTVTAFPVRHGNWPRAYGYRFEAPDRTVVVSGDTTATEEVVRACDGCDVLVHEVYALAGFDGLPEGDRAYHSSFHTSTAELARIAAEARPGLLVLYHQLAWERDGLIDDGALVSEVRRAYSGRVVSGRDLDVY